MISLDEEKNLLENDTEYLRALSDNLDKNDGYLSMFDKYQYNVNRLYHLYLHVEYLLEPTSEHIKDQREDIEESLQTYNSKQNYLMIFLWKKMVIFIDKTQDIYHHLEFIWFTNIKSFQINLDHYLMNYQSKKNEDIKPNPLEDQFILRGSPEEQEWNERVLNSKGVRSDQSDVFKSIHDSINKISRNNALEIVKNKYNASYLESHYPQLYKKLYKK